MSILDLLRPAPPKEEIQDQELVDKKYKYWRYRIFYGMYVGYAFYYFTRKSFTFAMPAMVTDLGFSKSELGIIGSLLAISYGISKFLSGVLGDRSNPRYFMAFGLILTGVINILFGLSSSVFFFAIFWGFNGWFQGWGWPPCAKLLTHWYSQSERGRWWGVWNTSHNVGGAVIPLLAGFVISLFGWRYALYFPGILAIVVGLFLINRLRDTPRSLGLPSIEKWRHESLTKGEYKEEEQNQPSAKELLVEYVLKNKYMWILAISYFFIYIIRTAVNDWSNLYLHQEKNYSFFSSNSCLFWFEMGGLVGSLAAGWISDKVFKGRRGPVNALYTLGVIAAVFALWYVPEGHLFLVSSVMFLIGFLIFGPQMLIGMAAAELSHKKAAGTATGFVGWFAYLGAATAGYPVGFFTEKWGWEGYFVILGVCGLIAALFLLPLWRVGTYRKPSIKEEMEAAIEEESIEEKEEEYSF